MKQVKSSREQSKIKAADSSDQINSSQSDIKRATSQNLLTGMSIHNPKLLLENQRYLKSNRVKLAQQSGTKSEMYFAKRYQYRSAVDLNKYFHNRDS